ncbi:MAG: tetratricopeptide repeat protein, partial [Pirellulaceae bacterium]
MTNDATPNWIVDATAENFQVEVIDRSREVPVVIDFWADWCQPCKQLMPILEGLAHEMAGQFALVKVNVEALPEIATQFNVQSVPAVFAMKDGELVDFFQGMAPPEVVRQWIERQLPSPAEKILTEVRDNKEMPIGERIGKLQDIVAEDNKLYAAQILLAELFLEDGQDEEAAKWIAALEERGFLEPEAERVKAALELKKLGEDAGDLDSCRAAVAEDPDSSEKKLALAEALAAAGKFEESLPLALEVLQRDKPKFGESARQLMVDVFRQMPEDSEVVDDFRRKLAAA